jgi:MDMPI C-terminal domain
MAGFMGKSQETPKVVAVTTTDPAMTFTLDTGGVTLTPGSTGASATLALPAEAFVRLVYGRLDDDADITSAVGITVPELQAVFPGF